MELTTLLTAALPRTGEQIRLTVLGILLLAIVVALVILLVKRRR